jgi:hypothetical protein
MHATSDKHGEPVAFDAVLVVDIGGGLEWEVLVVSAATISSRAAEPVSTITHRGVPTELRLWLAVASLVKRRRPRA